MACGKAGGLRNLKTDCPVLASSGQLLLVVAPDWDSPAGVLHCFERGAHWLPAFPPMPVSLGKSGLAWGRGLHANDDRVGPQKREGDGRAPAGIFAILALFGEAAAETLLGRAAKLPWLAATADLKAIDDPASAFYNRIVDQSAVTPDWASCEDMLRDDERYAIGAVVAHNSDPVVPGGGSCIFLHVWGGEGVPTAGCTAMALVDMKALAGWLDAATAPVLVQLPLAEYAARRAAWGLPSLPGVASAG